MKDLHFTGDEPEWAKKEVLDGKPKADDIEALHKEIDWLWLSNWDISAEFEKTW